ncbi:MAG: YciI family protein [Rhodoferax sp.]
MFIVSLALAGNPAQAAPHMAAHKAWLQQGFDDGVFLASGNLMGQPGGGIVVHGVSEAELHERLDQDPFVSQGIVSVQVVGITPTRVDSRLAFLRESEA